MHFSKELFSFINNMTGKNELLDKIMMISSKSIPYILMMILAGVFFYGVFKKDKGKRILAVNVVIKTFICIVLSQIVGKILFLQRPFVVYPETNLLYPHEANASFPSDHSLGSMSIAYGLKNSLGIISKINIILAVFVGITRVYVGHHFPLDVVGGFVIAIVFSKIYDKYLLKYVSAFYEKIETYVPFLR